ncbi:MAG: glycosyltransferase family 4 protein [Candidatus Thiothrix putei]|uniref:Glycosyltransferase family 4 protein n=1 Tax=Candidatus Thiothrix putei TaxID=3080811 RepID=A0AA95HFK7_9GAMM|nr:MAG: glycosyltransferase family 4 protein [Candidatus Thiothrix putei]
MEIARARRAEMVAYFGCGYLTAIICWERCKLPVFSKKRGKRLLFLTKYDQTGASSRYRTYQYLPHLTSIDYSVSPLLTGQYLQQRFTQSRLAQLWFIAKAYAARCWCILQAPRHYDLLFIEYELLPYFPAWLERYLHWRKIPYIVDYDDALFHQYDHHRNPVIRQLLGNKIATVMRLSQHVIAGNRYLAEYAHNAGAKCVSIIPTVIDLEHYRKAADYPKAEVFTIVWIGSPSTTPYLKEVLPALQTLSQHYPLRLRLIGAGDIDMPGITVERLAWQQDKEVEYISQCHVGIMPLPDTPWTRGKCGFKLIQYMACGLPIIASPVGINAEIIESGKNGFLASNHKDWITAIEKFLKHPKSASDMGETGLKKIIQKYCLKKTQKKFATLIRCKLEKYE